MKIPLRVVADREGQLAVIVDATGAFVASAADPVAAGDLVALVNLTPELREAAQVQWQEYERLMMFLDEFKSNKEWHDARKAMIERWK